MKSTENSFLKLYPNVITTKGYNRSTLIDLFTSKLHFVPNSVVDFINYLVENKTPFPVFLSELDDEETREQVIQYYDFIIENNLGQLVDEFVFSGLSPLPLNFYPSSKIEDAIIELDGGSSWDLMSFLNDLNTFGTKHLEVRFLDYDSFISHALQLKVSLLSSTIESVHILVPYNDKLKRYIEENLTDFQRLQKLTIYNTNSGFELNAKYINLVFTKQNSISSEHCGNVSTEYFTINTPAYVRNKNHNSCMAFKLSIDKNGEIKNCPSQSDSFGSISNIKINDVIKSTEFRKFWNITKTEISICSDCEFQNVCKDCRVFVSGETLTSKPSKCTYNPYISLWYGDEKYLPESECGITFEGRQIIIDHDRISKINQEIWE